MAERPVTEVTELKRIPLNQAQGKKIQIMEFEWVPATSVADDDTIALNDLPGVDSVLAILTFESWDGGALDGRLEGTAFTQGLTRRAATGTTDAPTAADDTLTLKRASTDGWNGVYFSLLVEST